MKIYSRTTTKFTQFDRYIGKDAWVKIIYTNHYSGYNTQWVRILSKTDTYYVCNLVPAVLNIRFEAPDYIDITQEYRIYMNDDVHVISPIEVLSTEELLQMLGEKYS